MNDTPTSLAHQNRASQHRQNRKHNRATSSLDVFGDLTGKQTKKNQSIKDTLTEVWQEQLKEQEEV